MTLSMQYRALGSFEPWPGNPKNHDVETLIASIQRFGFNTPIVLEESTGRILAGHGRIEALKEIKKRGEPAPERIQVAGKKEEWKVPCVSVPFASEEEAKAFLLADNRLTELGGWDETALSEMIAGCISSNTDLLGWSERDIRIMLKQADSLAPPLPPKAAPTEEGSVFDSPPELPEGRPAELGDPVTIVVWFPNHVVFEKAISALEALGVETWERRDN